MRFITYQIIDNQNRKELARIRTAKGKIKAFFIFHHENGDDSRILQLWALGLIKVRPLGNFFGHNFKPLYCDN